MRVEYTIGVIVKPLIQIQTISAQSPESKPHYSSVKFSIKPMANPNFSQATQNSNSYKRKTYKRFHIIEIHSIQMQSKPIVSICVTNSQAAQKHFLIPPLESLDKQEQATKSLRKLFEDISDIPKDNFDSRSELDFCVKSQESNEKSLELELKRENSDEFYDCTENQIFTQSDLNDKAELGFVKPELPKQDCVKKPKKIMNFLGDMKITVSSLEDNINKPGKFEERKNEEKRFSELLANMDKQELKPNFLEISIKNPLKVSNRIKKRHTKSLPKLKIGISNELKQENPLNFTKSLKKSNHSLKLLPKQPPSIKPQIKLSEKIKVSYTKSLTVSNNSKAPNENPYSHKWTKKVLKKYLNFTPLAEKSPISLPKLKSIKP